MPTGENAFLKGLCRPADVGRRLTSQSDRRTSGESSRAALTSLGRRRSRTQDRLRGDNSSKRAEGVPAFGLPVLFLIFLVSRSFSKFNGSNQASLSGRSG